MLTIAQLLESLESLEPGLCGRIRGASPELIARLERVAERRLPEVQRQLLERMGEDLGGICAGFVGADMRAASLVERFEARGWIPPAPFVLVGVDDAGAPMDSFLRCAPDLAEPELVQFAMPGGVQALVASGPDNYRVMAPSLPAWLFRCAFTNFVGGRYRWVATAEVFEAQPDHGARFDALLSARGFFRQHGSDHMTGALWTQEAAVLWTRNALDDPVFVAIYADEPARVDELAFTLAGVTAMRRYSTVANDADADADEDEEDELG
ncbi:hypothetical protein G6O69_29355 [Pseudenhygromyxa sp. WMMC2535]|uniref:hypothetical protein n=1 Tax=Pseudenhygromyxa sp. WMMC2535 TaxID=2712867 RepID=UPI0015558E5C|nr:hypothetical protein [Pseudenhygromyxa sp. WMMC2535]NVB41971.1 hypothetical protein [Pseudenhygromyxa sp. WMMC2535]